MKFLKTSTHLKFFLKKDTKETKKEDKNNKKKHTEKIKIWIMKMHIIDSSQEFCFNQIQSEEHTPDYY